MKLGFYYHIPAITRLGEIRVPGYFGRFLDSLAEYFDLSLFLHTPDPNEVCYFDYEIRSKNVRLFQLPPRQSLPYRLLHERRFLRIIEGNKEILDAFLIRAPSPLLPSIARSIRPTPTVLLIVGDYLAGISSLPQPGWRKFLIRLAEWQNYRGQLRAAKESLVFVNSHLLYDHYKGKVNNLIETRTTTLTDQDFYYREDTCVTRPIQLLYAGRMDPPKGLFDMVRAVSLIVKQGQDVVLNLVGWVDGDPNLMNRINEFALKEGINERVKFHGYKATGPELFDWYKHADIFILASQASEGFPRAIWEAMAHSLPVIATNVGSISNYIQDSAVIIEPKNPSAIADAVLRLINDSQKRQTIIKRGRLLVKENTLNQRAKQMSTEINKYLLQEQR